jgi:glutathione S-transferase
LATPTNTTLLYTFRRCPYAIRARLALWYVGISFELREVVLKNKPQSMLDVSSKGTVPVLVLSDGTVLDESIDIMRWALAQSDPDDWSAQSLSNPLVERNDGDFKHYLDRYKYVDRYPDYPQQTYLQQACVFIAELESNLSQDTDWLTGDTVSALDMAIFPFVRQFALVDKTIFAQLPYPNVQRWLYNLLNGELFHSVMLKYSAWQPDQPPIFINE